MTKKATPPEVWDYASAEAFLKAGRNKEQRPLKDGWNTVLRRITPEVIDVGLHGDTVVRYLDTDHIVVFPDKAMSFVAMQRIQKYGLGSRYLVEKHAGGWRVFGESERLAYSLTSDEGVPVTSHLGVMPAGGIELNDKREIVGAPLPSVGWRSSNELRRWSKLLRAWTSEYMKLLANGMPLPGTPCGGCRPEVNSNPLSLGWVLQDPEHLFAHVIEDVHPPEVVMEAVDIFLSGRPRTEMLPLNAKGDVTVASGKETDVERVLMSHMKRTMRVW